MNKQEIEQKWKVVDMPKHKIKDACWVEVIAQIMHVETATVREYKTHEIFTYGEAHPSTFNWAENNFSCDCNRSLFFYRAVGEEEPENENQQCTDGQYLVKLVNPVDGKIYYDEFPFTNINSISKTNCK